MSSPSESRQHGPTDPSCLEVFARLSEYLDGELALPDCQHIEEHMQDCAPCIEFLESLKSSVRAAREFQSGEAPAALPEEVREKLRSAWQAALAKRSE